MAFVSQALNFSRRVVPFTMAALLLGQLLSGRKLLFAWFPGPPCKEGPSAPGTGKMPTQKGQVWTVPGNRAGTLVQRILRSEWISCHMIEHTLSDL